MPFGEPDGLSLYYERAGSGEPPVVFGHGWCCDHTHFQPQFDHFKSSHSVIALDLRGFGRSHGSKIGHDPGASQTMWPGSVMSLAFPGLLSSATAWEARLLSSSAPGTPPYPLERGG